MQGLMAGATSRGCRVFITVWAMARRRQDRIGPLIFGAIAFEACDGIFRMSRPRMFAVAVLAVLLSCGPVFAQRGNDFDSLLAQMTAAMQAGRMADALAAAERLEILIRRRQGTDNMNYAGVLHNEGMFL